MSTTEVILLTAVVSMIALYIHLFITQKKENDEHINRNRKGKI